MWYMGVLEESRCLKMPTPTFCESLNLRELSRKSHSVKKWQWLLLSSPELTQEKTSVPETSNLSTS